MGTVTLIAAVGKNRELGYKNDLIWKIPEDLKFFKENTIGKSIVMGINTLNSLPNLLVDRKHIVLTHKDLKLDDSIVVVHSICQLLQYIDSTFEEVMIIGGARVYSQMIEYADKMLLTEIDDEALADVYFPEFLIDNWDRELISNHSYNGINYSHVMYKRREITRKR